MEIYLCYGGDLMTTYICQNSSNRAGKNGISALIMEIPQSSLVPSTKTQQEGTSYELGRGPSPECEHAGP